MRTGFLTIITGAIFVSEVKKKSRSSRRKTAAGCDRKQWRIAGTYRGEGECEPVVSYMRLEADKVDISFYEEQAIKRGMPLTSGIGSPAIDKNSIENLDVTKLEMAEMAKSPCCGDQTGVCEAIDLPEDNHVGASWPSHISFEDVNGESQFDLIEIILDEVYKCPPIEQSDRAVALEA